MDGWNHPGDGAGDRMHRPETPGSHRGRLRRMFEPALGSAPYGAASISLLVNLLDDRTKAGAWSDQRRRVHARSLLELASDHYFSEAELVFLTESLG